MFTKPGVLARSLNITTDALRKQRIRDTSPYEYEVINGRVMYITSSLPPSVRKNIEKITTNKTRTPHNENKSFRYWNSIGKVNERKIQNRKKNIEAEVQGRLAEEREAWSMVKAPPIKKVYAYWINPNSIGNYWKSFDDYENSKKKKSISFY